MEINGWFGHVIHNLAQERRECFTFNRNKVALHFTVFQSSFFKFVHSGVFRDSHIDLRKT